MTEERNPANDSLMTLEREISLHCTSYERCVLPDASTIDAPYDNAGQCGGSEKVLE